MVNSSAIVSLTLTFMVIAISAAVAIFFGMSSDPNAEDYNYSMEFTSEYSYPDGTKYFAGEFVINQGVQVSRFEPR